MLKKNKLRYNEYYDMQHIYDELYAQSKNGNNFYKLLEIIGSEQNICLAYRNLKSNSGSKTAGTDGMTIDDIKRFSNAEIVATVRESLSNYRPKSVRRVFIPKAGSDKMRPLGIPCIWDRLVQQCILQVLEPICEPKFHNHSYGFRANRSAHHAVSRVTTLINLSKYHYCVDVDIKGFFDNVNHGKLLKQIWTLGIRDKRLICIISKMLKAEIDGEGVPEKGTPQGGLLSPLLSLIVLNELDWWVSSQWETFQPKNRSKNGWLQYAKKYTKLKSGFIVRYADDFKIMCSTYGEAQRFYHSTVDFLNKRLKLEISPEKSKVVNLKKNSSDFLGFKIKVIPKGRTKHGYVAKTDMNQKALKKAHPDIIVEKKSDSPDEDKCVHDSKLLIPTLKDFFSKHPLINPKTFLGDAAFDSCLLYRELLTGNTFGQNKHFAKAYIPLNSRSGLENPDYKVNEDGIPCCPDDDSLPMKHEGTSTRKNGLKRYKFICPKIKYVKDASTGKYHRHCICNHPCTASECGRMIYVYPEKDLRAYPGTIRGTEEWDNTYKIRTAVERDINHIKENLCLAGRRTQNEKTLYADLILAGITQLITVILADKIKHHEYIRSLKPLIA